MAIGERFVIFAKVRLADIFFVTRRQENFSYFNRIAQRHVDFLLCDPATLKPLLGIELDDASHQRPRRRERDAFVDEVFRAAALPLLRFPAQSGYNTGEVRAKIMAALGQETPSAGTQATGPKTKDKEARAAAEAQVCPKCDAPLVLKIARRGKYKGQRFYACTNYPDCRYIRPISSN